MEKVLQLQRLLLRSRRISLLAIAVTLVILAGVILLATLRLRGQIREQLAGRDGRILHAVALTHAQDPEVTMLGSIEDPANQLTVVLKTSGIRGLGRETGWGVMAARLFDAQGQFLESFPVGVLEGSIPAADLPRLRNFEPVSLFRPAVRWHELFLADPAASSPAPDALPILEVYIPLYDPAKPRLAAVAQFIIEGHSLAAEFSRLDRNLALQGSAAFLVSGSILALVIGWAFRRLRRANRLLAERTDNLLKANQELALAAKTSALGAVTAHLIHGLKSPLSGLQHFVKTIGASPPEGVEASRQLAAASTHRMQALINQVVNILREEKTSATYEVTLAELTDLISAQIAPLAVEHHVQFLTKIETETLWPNRVASLVSLILVNLLQNAIQATPAGRTTSLTLIRRDGDIVCQVRDQGPGFPPGIALFAPCSSTKPASAGIGLAVSHQLANHLGAKLELQDNSPAGCLFALTLPAQCPEHLRGARTS